MRERFYAFDFLRAFMMFLGVFLHGLLFDPTISFLHETWNVRTMTFLAEVIHTFRMPLFFCLSGYVSSQLFRKLGVGAFCINRLRRVFLPFVLSILTIGFLSNLFHHVLVLFKKEQDILSALRTSFSLRYFHFEEMEPIHLWFLYYLSAFIPTILIINYVTKRVRVGFIGSMVDWIGRRPKSQPIVVLMLAFIPTLLLFVTNNNGNPTPRSFAMSLESFLPYFYYFGFGWFIHRFQFNMHYFTKNAWWFLAVAILLTAGRLVAWSLLGEKQLLAIIILFNLSLWCYIFGFMGIVQVHFNRSSGLVQYFSDASYWIYLIHYPIIVAFKLFFYEPTTLSTFSLLLLITVILSVLSYNYLVRPTWVGKLLNGKVMAPYAFHKIQISWGALTRAKRFIQLQYYRIVLRNFRLLRSKNLP